MVGIGAAQIVDMQGHAGMVNQPLEEFADQIHVKLTNAGADEFDIEFQAGTTGEVDHHPGERLVEGNVGMAVTGQPLFVPPGLGQRLTDGDPDIFDSVMIIDLNIANRRNIKIDQAVAGDLVEHVVKEGNAGGELALAAAIEIKTHGNLRFKGVTCNFSLPHGEIRIVSDRLILPLRPARRRFCESKCPLGSTTLVLCCAQIAPSMSETRRFRTLALTLLWATAVSIALYWWQLLSSNQELRSKTLDQATQTASRLAVAGAAQIDAIVRNMDAVIDDLRYDYLRHPDEFDEAVRRAMRSQPDGLVLQIGSINAEGILSYSSLGNPGGVYLGDREHFRAHQEAESGDALYVSAPVFGRRSNNWSIQFSRKIEHKGRFLGVMVVSISPEYLSRQLARFELGENDTIALFRNDGTYLSRTPKLSDYLGKTVRADRPFLLPDAPAQGSFRSVATHDPISRHYAWHRSAPYPLIVVAGISESNALAPLETEIRSSNLRNGLGTLVVTLLAGTLAWLILRLGQHQAAQLRSAETYRSLFEKNTSVKLIIDPKNGQIVDANQAACAFYGYGRDQIKTLRISDINVLEAEQISAEMELARTEKRQYFNFTHRLANGELRQVEVYSGPLEVEGRSLLHSIIHDVTARRQLELELQRSASLLRGVFNALPDGVLLVDPEGNITHWNDAALRVLDVDEENLQQRHHCVLYPDGRRVPPEDYPTLRATHGHPVFNNELYAIEREGQPLRWVAASARPLPPTADGKPGGEVISAVDVSRLIELEATHLIAQSVFESTTEGIMVCDAQSRITRVNPAFSAITGYQQASVIGRNPSFLASGHHDQAFYRTMYETLARQDHWEGEITNRRQDGSIYIAWLKIAVIRESNQNIQRYVALFSDITVKKRQEQEVWHQANYDALTNLPNRVLLNDRLQQAIAQCVRRNGQAALLYIDLDRFKPVNDTHGHQAGDELLRQVAHRIGNCLRDEDTVARIGGDEFLVLLPTITHRQAALTVAEKILESLCLPFRLPQATVDIAASIGIALYPEHGTTAEALLEHGDAAMYRAKSEGRHTVRVYSPAAGGGEARAKISPDSPSA